jgi:hypothetical protein
MSFLLAVCAGRQVYNRIGIKRRAGVRLMAGILVLQQRAKHGRSLPTRWAGRQDRLSPLFGVVLNGALHDHLAVGVPGGHGVVEGRSPTRLVAGNRHADADLGGRRH